MSLERAKGWRWPPKTLMVSASGPPDAQDLSPRPTGATMRASSAQGLSGGHQGRMGKTSSGGSSNPMGTNLPLKPQGIHPATSDLVFFTRPQLRHGR